MKFSTGTPRQTSARPIKVFTAGLQVFVQLAAVPAAAHGSCRSQKTELRTVGSHAEAVTARLSLAGEGFYLKQLRVFISEDLGGVTGHVVPHNVARSELSPE